MDYFFCALLGYLLGSLSPAALVSRATHTNLRTSGTGNLGATNTMLVLGKGFGAAVMLFDIAKGCCAALLGQALFPGLKLATLTAGGAAVVGHVFPFYMKFRGGKGLAAFGGMVLAFDWMIFLGLLVLGVGLMFLIGYSVALPVSASLLFPVLAGLKTRSFAVFLLSGAISALLLWKHWENIRWVLEGKERKVSEYIRKYIFRKR